MSVARSGSLHAIPFTRPRVRPEKALQYELRVVAAEVADVVSGIGGWLFDQAMAGWRVSVAAGAGDDERALRILGLKAIGLEGLWRSAEPDSVTMTAISSDVFESGDDGLALRDHRGDVVFFGSPDPVCLGGTVQPVKYRPSNAALAFKAHAFAAAGMDPKSAAQAEALLQWGASESSRGDASRYCGLRPGG